MDFRFVSLATPRVLGLYGFSFSVFGIGHPLG